MQGAIFKSARRTPPCRLFLAADGAARMPSFRLMCTQMRLYAIAAADKGCIGSMLDDDLFSWGGQQIHASRHVR